MDPAGPVRRIRCVPLQAADVIFRIEGAYPNSREMITPLDLSKAPQLEEVFRVDI